MSAQQNEQLSSQVPISTDTLIDRVKARKLILPQRTSDKALCFLERAMSSQFNFYVPSLEKHKTRLEKHGYSFSRGEYSFSPGGTYKKYPVLHAAVLEIVKSLSFEKYEQVLWCADFSTDYEYLMLIWCSLDEEGYERARRLSPKAMSIKIKKEDNIARKELNQLELLIEQRLLQLSKVIIKTKENELAMESLNQRTEDLQKHYQEKGNPTEQKEIMSMISKMQKEWYDAMKESAKHKFLKIISETQSGIFSSKKFEPEPFKETSVRLGTAQKLMGELQDMENAANGEDVHHIGHSHPSQMVNERPTIQNDQLMKAEEIVKKIKGGNVLDNEQIAFLMDTFYSFDQDGNLKPNIRGTGLQVIYKKDLGAKYDSIFFDDRKPTQRIPVEKEGFDLKNRKAMKELVFDPTFCEVFINNFLDLMFTDNALNPAQQLPKSLHKTFGDLASSKQKLVQFQATLPTQFRNAISAAQQEVLNSNPSEIRVILQQLMLHILAVLDHCALATSALLVDASRLSTKINIVSGALDTMLTSTEPAQISFLKIESFMLYPKNDECILNTDLAAVEIAKDVVIPDVRKRAGIFADKMMKALKANDKKQTMFKGKDTKELAAMIMTTFQHTDDLDVKIPINIDSVFRYALLERSKFLKLLKEVTSLELSEIITSIETEARDKTHSWIFLSILMNLDVIIKREFINIISGSKYTLLSLYSLHDTVYNVTAIARETRTQICSTGLDGSSQLLIDWLRKLESYRMNKVINSQPSAAPSKEFLIYSNFSTVTSKLNQLSLFMAANTSFDMEAWETITIGANGKPSHRRAKVTSYNKDPKTNI